MAGRLVRSARSTSTSTKIWLREAEKGGCAFYLFIRQPMGRKSALAARNTLDSARIPRASKLLICGLFLKGRVLAQDGGALKNPTFAP